MQICLGDSSSSRGAGCALGTSHLALTILFLHSWCGKQSHHHPLLNELVGLRHYIFSSPLTTVRIGIYPILWIILVRRSLLIFVTRIICSTMGMVSNTRLR